MRVMKAVQQQYAPTNETLWLLDQFRQMLNHCIQIGLAENATSLKSLSLKAYRQLGRYDVISYYKLCAISAAAGILRNYHKAKRKNKRSKEPYARRLRLATCYGFKIMEGYLLLPFKPKQPIQVPLNKHTMQVISEPSLQVRSITMTDHTLNISYAKNMELIKPRGLLAIDRNLDNLTTADTDEHIVQHDLSNATRIKATYREVRSHMKRNDIRVRRRISGKYGRKQREKVKQILHHASKQIVADAKTRQFGIVMEKLAGIRKLYRRGNWQGRWYRARLNSWSFAELQRQIEYKAAWESIPVIHVAPHGTSAKCSMCGSRMFRAIPEENRQLRCANCGVTVDRDINAARNILARAVRFTAFAPAKEAMVQEPAQQQAAILKVDAGELTQKP